MSSFHGIRSARISQAVPRATVTVAGPPAVSLLTVRLSPRRTTASSSG